MFPWTSQRSLFHVRKETRQRRPFTWQVRHIADINCSTDCAYSYAVSWSTNSLGEIVSSRYLLHFCRTSAYYTRVSLGGAGGMFPPPPSWICLSWEAKLAFISPLVCHTHFCQIWESNWLEAMWADVAIAHVLLPQSAWPASLTLKLWVRRSGTTAPAASPDNPPQSNSLYTHFQT